VTVNDRLVALADITKYNVAVAVVARPAGPDPRALSHDKITEIYYVLKGSGTQLTGTLVNGTHQDTSKTIGPGMSSESPSLIEKRAIELDTIAAALPIGRRDELADLLTEDVETLRHLVNAGMGENTLRALTSDLA